MHFGTFLLRGVGLSASAHTCVCQVRGRERAAVREIRHRTHRAGTSRVTTGLQAVTAEDTLWASSFDTSTSLGYLDAKSRHKAPCGHGGQAAEWTLRAAALSHRDEGSVASQPPRPGTPLTRPAPPRAFTTLSIIDALGRPRHCWRSWGAPCRGVAGRCRGRTAPWTARHVDGEAAPGNALCRRAPMILRAHTWTTIRN